MEGKMLLRLLVPAFAAGFVAVIGLDCPAAEDTPYVVKDGKVNTQTFNGWRRYTESCLRCHGPDGAGSSYAPDLLDSLKHLDHDQFAEVVVNGRSNVTSSQQNVRPPFGEVEAAIG